MSGSPLSTRYALSSAALPLQTSRTGWTAPARDDPGVTDITHPRRMALDLVLERPFEDVDPRSRRLLYLPRARAAAEVLRRVHRGLPEGCGRDDGNNSHRDDTSREHPGAHPGLCRPHARQGRYTVTDAAAPTHTDVSVIARDLTCTAQRGYRPQRARQSASQVHRYLRQALTAVLTESLGRPRPGAARPAYPGWDAGAAPRSFRHK